MGVSCESLPTPSLPDSHSQVMRKIYKSTPRKHGRCYLTYCCRSNGCRKTCAIDVAGLSPACTRHNLVCSSALMQNSYWLSTPAISSVLCHLGKSGHGQKSRLLSRSLTLVPSSRFCAEDCRYKPPKIRGRSKVKTAFFCPSFNMTSDSLGQTMGPRGI